MASNSGDRKTLLDECPRANSMSGSDKGRSQLVCVKLSFNSIAMVFSRQRLSALNEGQHLPTDYKSHLKDRRMWFSCVVVNLIVRVVCKFENTYIPPVDPLWNGRWNRKLRMKMRPFPGVRSLNKHVGDCPASH